MSAEVNKKYVLTYEADVKSYVDGTEKISVATRRMAVNSKKSAAEVEAAVSAAGLKNVKVYEESATTLARTVKSQLASNNKLVSSHKSASRQIIAANDATYSAIQRNARGNRAVMQSAGYQLQDVIVQAQQNTNAWMILSQQGSQFASSFGAGGVVAGAIISVVGLLGMMATSGGEAADALEDVEDNFRNMSKAAKELAAEEATERLEEENETLEAMKVTLREATEEYDKLIKIRKSGAFGELESVDVDGSKEARALNEITVAMERQQAVVDDLTKKKQMLTSVPFVDPGQSKVYTAEYKSRLATMEEMTKSMERQTRTFEEEYAYRKSIIDSFLLTEEEEARHYGALEAWKTQELKKEADKRAKIAQAETMSAIQASIKAENARKSSLSGSVNQIEQLIPAPNYDEYESELMRHAAFKESYAQAYAATNEWDLNERTRLNNAKELEETRHAEAMTRIVTEAMESQVQAQISGYEQLSGTLASAAEEGSAAFKILFAVQQGFAIANGTMQAFSTAQTAYATAYQAAALANTGSPVAHVVALAEAEGAYATSLSLGLANVGATAGVAFAGAFDKGGEIPNNQMGIVSEFGDELVGGTLVYNQSGSPLGVTGREKTSEMMASSKGSGQQVELAVSQNFYINGNPDKSALAEMKQMANNSRDEAYAMVSRDFASDRGISRNAARRR